jgi:trk system potassium uptake protein TrkA
MKKKVAIIGLGRFGSSLANTLFKMGHDVLAIDSDEKRVQVMSSLVAHIVYADAINEATLKELGIPHFDVAVVCMGSDIRNSVLTTILLKNLGVPYVIARANDELHGAILEKIGADRVVYPLREMGIMVAHALTLTNVLDYISVSPTHGVAKLAAPESFVGKTLSELGLGREHEHGMVVLLVQRQKEIIVTPDGAETVKPNDILIVAGNDDDLERLLTQAKP